MIKTDGDFCNKDCQYLLFNERGLTSPKALKCSLFNVDVDGSVNIAWETDPVDDERRTMILTIDSAERCDECLLYEKLKKREEKLNSLDLG